MKKVNSKYLTLFVLLVIILISIIVIFYRGANGHTPEDVAQCISGKATLYTQLGCHACEYQEDLFGDSYQHLDVVDCYFEREKCGEITGTPTWIINGEKYLGVQSIEKLKELTGC